MRKQLFKIIMRQKREIIYGLSLAVLTMLAGVALLALSGWLIASCAFAGVVGLAASFNYFTGAAAIRSFALLRILGRYGDRVFNHEATFKILRDLRVWIYSKLLLLSPHNWFSRKQGDLLNRLLSDVDALDNLYVRMLMPFFIAIFTVAAVFCLFYYFETTIAYGVLIILLLTLCVVTLFMFSFNQKASRALHNHAAQLREDLIDQFSGLTEILIYHQQKIGLESLLTLDKSYLAAQKKLYAGRGWAMTFIGIATAVTLGFILMKGVLCVHANHLNGAILAMMALAILAAFEALLPLPLAFQFLGKTMLAITRIQDIATEKSEIKFPEQTVSLPTDLTLTISDLSLSFPKRTGALFQNFNLTIHSHEKIAIVGGSGIGKSTLALLLTRLEKYDSGMISIGSVPIEDFSEEDLRHLICYIPQTPYFFNQSIRENLALANADLDDTRVNKVLALMQLDVLVDQLPEKLDTLMGEWGKRFSGGQLRRFALCQALLSNARIIILDEPSEGLDNHLLHEIMPDLMKNFENKTLMIITHDENMFQYVDRLINLETCAHHD